MARKSLVPAGYPALLARVKERVRTAQINAALSTNRELILLYWDIGHAIVEAQKDKGYGRRVVEVLSVDLRREFPTMTGLSALNLWRMRAFYLAYASNQKLSQPVTESDFRRHRIVKQTVSEIVAQPVRDSSPSILSQPVTESAGAIELITSLPWGQTLCSRKKLSNSVRAFGTPEPRWKTAGHEACLSFATLPAPQSDLAHQTLKDPYVFDFLTMDVAARERDLELGLLNHIQKFLVELGVGFALVGRQYRLDVSREEFFLDLLFYHMQFRCFLVVDFKMEAIKPEFSA